MNEQIEIYEKKFDRALQEKVNQIKNEYHINHVNKELEKNNVKRLEINSFANTKNLLREISGLENDLSNFQRIKKQIQKLDIMLNSDIPNREKEKNFEQTLNRVDEELKKGQGMLEDIASSPTVYKNYRDKNIGNFREVIDKLTSSLKENKIILIAIINFYMKISRTYYYIYRNKNLEIPNTNEEIQNLEKKKQSQILDDLKLQLINILNYNIDDMIYMIPQNKMNDIKNSSKELIENYNKMNIVDVFQRVCEIFLDIITKYEDYKSEKETQINNLTQQVLFLLKKNENIIKKEEKKFNELNENDDNFQKKNDLLSKKISVKEDELNQLREINKNLNSTINDLKKENQYLKQQNNEIYSEIQNINYNNNNNNLFEKIKKNRENIQKTNEELSELKKIYNDYGYIKTALNKNKNLQKRLERNYNKSREKKK